MTDSNRPLRVLLFGQAEDDVAYELRDFPQRSAVTFDSVPRSLPPVMCGADRRNSSRPL